MNSAGMELDGLLAHVIERQQVAFKAQLDQHYSRLAQVLQQAGQKHYQHVPLSANGTQPQTLHVAMQSPESRSEGAGVRNLRGMTMSAPPPVPVEGAKEDGEMNAICSLNTRSASKLSRSQTTPASNGRRQKSKIRSLVEKRLSIESDSVRGKLLVLLNGRISTFVGICIVLNTLMMFVELTWLGNKANVLLGLADSRLPPADDVFDILEFGFCVIFLIELVLQLYASRCHFFSSGANILDLIIVLVTSIEIFILTPLAANLGNVSFIRMLRLTKFVRALRVVRTLRSFEGLRVLIATVIHSFASMIWAMLVLLIFQVMFAIFLCQSLNPFVLEEENDLEMRLWVNQHYGDGFKALYTIFELTLSGCWPNYSRPIIERVNTHYAWVFVVYITFVVFAMIRVISALFLKETLQQAARDAEMMVRERSKKSNALQKELGELFDEADTSRDGVLSIDELSEMMSHPKVTLWLQELGVEVTDTGDLFELLDDGDGQITSEEFIQGITRLKGEARAKDLVKIMASVHRVELQCREVCAKLDSFTYIADYCPVQPPPAVPPQIMATRRSQADVGPLHPVLGDEVMDI